MELCIFCMDELRELIKQEKLEDARNLLIEAVKTSPADRARRFLLFKILVLHGQWDKAERHLDIIASQAPEEEKIVLIYKNLINAEKLRSQVVKGETLPSFVSTTPLYFESYVNVRQKIKEKSMEDGEKLFTEILENRPLISGTINGKDFTGFQDTDTLLSFFIEAVVYERYVWIGIESLRELSVSPPQELLDIIWSSARITTWDGLTLNCLLPVLYPDSAIQDDNRIKLGRMTDWESSGGPFFRGYGQHVFHVGEEDVPILKLGEVIFNSPVRMGE